MKVEPHFRITSDAVGIHLTHSSLFKFFDGSIPSPVVQTVLKRVLDVHGKLTGKTLSDDSFMREGIKCFYDIRKFGYSGIALEYIPLCFIK